MKCLVCHRTLTPAGEWDRAADLGGIARLKTYLACTACKIVYLEPPIPQSGQDGCVHCPHTRSQHHGSISYDPNDRPRCSHCECMGFMRSNLDGN